MFYWNYKANNSASNIWSTSLLNKTNLNTNYLNNIGSKWDNMIDITTWIVGGISFTSSLFGSKVTYQNEIVNPATSTTYDAKVGLMYGSDYGLASSLFDTEVQSENWINLYLSEWLITPVSGSSGISFIIDSVGKVESKDSSFGYAVRPAFYLLSSIIYLSGSGTQSDPIRISL